ncbi:MAG: DUF3299 domain-containing protein [Bacteroidota bacterium]
MKHTLISLFLLLSLTSVAQTRINWDILADVNFVVEYDETLGMSQNVPRFGEDPQQYEGEQVSISGYTIPIDGTGKYYVLSKFPYSNCYFCGNAGPETIVEISLKPKAQRRFKTDQRVTVVGKLQLNERDLYSLPYKLVEAEVEEL